MQAEIAFLCPLAVEWRALCEQLDGAHDDPSVRTLPAKLGRVAKHTVVCIRSGKGEGNAAAALQYTMRNWEPRWVLLVGVAAGFPSTGVRRGDVIIANYVYGLDFGKLEDGRYKRRPEYDLQPDVGLLRYAENLAEDENRPWLNRIKVARPDGAAAGRTDVHVGYVASGNKVVDDPGHQFFQAVMNSLQEVHAVEMEASGAGASIRLEQSQRLVGFLMVRGISDEPVPASVGKVSSLSGSQQRRAWKKYAAAAAAAFVAEYIGGLDLAPSPPNFAQAYGEGISGHMLSRETLDERDFEQDDAVKPPKVDALVEALTRGESVAVQGPPGSGKSALAAWANWIGKKKGLLFAAFEGRELQGGDPSAGATRLQGVPSDRILIIDDIHLAEPVLRHLRPLFRQRRFLLLGRKDYVDRAWGTGLLPTGDERPTNITAQDSECIADKLARKYLPDEGQATRLLRRTRKDLVYTKWLLEETVVHQRSIDSAPKNAAIAKLKALRSDRDYESVRLFLTLAAFGWVELWCPETFLADTLGFEPETLEGLHELIHEAERRERPEAIGGYALRLLRHPELCKLFLDAAPKLGLAFDKRIFALTCAEMKLESDVVKSYGFAPLILGAGVADKLADLDSIAWRLIYGGRGSDYVNIVKAAAELLCARYPVQPGLDLPLHEKESRLTLAFAAANGERRLHRGQAAKALLEELRRRLGVIDIPTEPFKDKGFILYQDAYLMRLDNTGQPALDRFEESAKADEAWAVAKNSPVHRGKAAMSRIAAAAYRIDMAVFSATTPGILHPDQGQLRDISKDLTVALKTQNDLLSSGIDEKAREQIEGYRTNALLHMAEAAGWLGDETTVNQCLNAVGPDADYYKRQVIMGLARGALALAKGQHDQVILALEGQPEKRVELGAGEGAGKVGVMLLLSLLRTGRPDAAEGMRFWLLSDQCPADGGNGLAKSWAARLDPIP